MSSDNFNYVDYEAERATGKWSVTTGFDSDDELPTPSERSARFETFEEAHYEAITDYSEYGVRFSQRAWDEFVSGAQERP